MNEQKQSNLLELVDACETYHFNNSDPDDDIRLLKAQELRELGFTAKADELEKELNKKIKLSRIENEKYIAISDNMIQKFLNRKAELYNADHKPKLNPTPTTDGSTTPFLDFLRDPNLYLQNPLSGRAQQSRNYREDYYDALMYNMQRQTRGYGFYDILLADTKTTLSAKTCDFMKTEEGTIGRYEWTEEKTSDYKGIPPENVLDVLKEHKDKQLFDYFTIASVNAVKDPLLLGRVEGCSERFFIAQWGTDVSLDDIL